VIRAAVIGAGFAAHLHAEALHATGRARVVGVCAPTPASRKAFADRLGATAYADVEALLDAEHPDVVTLALPNDGHEAAAMAAAARGIHVVCEKPLAPTLEAADRMLLACREAGVMLLYAEQLCFAPRYVRVRGLLHEGAFGRVVQVSHRERHGGPHAAWFRDRERSGGGVLLDMGCHGIEVARWLLHKEPVVSVHARTGTFRHEGADVEDHALVTLRFASGALAVVDASWAAPGGIDERLEVLGTHGTVTADLARGASLLVYSDAGVGYAAEKAEHTRGWSWVAPEEARTWGWHAEFTHFVACLEGRAAPVETGEDGRAVLEVVQAAYRSAAEGAEVALGGVVAP
jgi:predicted dehydrogenase